MSSRCTIPPPWASRTLPSVSYHTVFDEIHDAARAEAKRTNRAERSVDESMAVGCLDLSQGCKTDGCARYVSSLEPGTFCEFVAKPW